MPVPEIEAVTRAIEEQRARWVPRVGPFTHLSDAELRSRLGVIRDDQRLEAIRNQAPVDLAAIIAEFEARLSPAPPVAGERATQAGAIEAVRARLALPPIPIPFPWWLFVVDWRNRKGRNNVTPVKDQGGCGSCVAFGSVATLESMVLIEHNMSTSLSEAELLFCGGGSCGGWWPDSAVTYIKSRGVSQESCFPYSPNNMPCHTCVERDGEAIKVTSNVVISDVTQRKHYLANVGPVMCVFEVYDDFFSYSTGVYSHVTGGLAGLHCVEVIGYDDFLGCWICKNSWGTGWGEAGYFQIAYGQCGIDSTYPYWGIYGTQWFI